MHRRAFLVSSAAVAACATAPTVPATNAGLQARLDSYLAPYVAARDFSGVVIMARGGAIVAQGRYGFASFERETPNTADTRYACASVGKLFTRAAIVALEREGKLSQDDAFARFMPEFPNAANFTIRQLIAHTAGISRDLSFGADVTRRLSLRELAQRIAAQPVGVAGARSSYSNNGYRLLALAIEVASGEDFDAVVQQKVLVPRGMRDTVENSLTAPPRNLATGYVPGRGLRSLEPAPREEQMNSRGAGSYCSTPNDLLKFARSLPIDVADLERPLATNADGSPRRRKLGHNGLGHGYANFCFSFPEQDAVLVMMGNIQGGMFTPLENNLEEILFDQPLSPVPQTPDRVAPLDLARAAIYVGNYELFPGTPLIVRLSGDLLEVSAGGDAFAPLTPMADGRFFMRQRYATLRFNVSADRSESILWAEPGGEFTLPRLP